MVALISGQFDVMDRITDAFGEEPGVSIRVLSDVDAVTAYLNFEFPEIVVIDCTDDSIPLQELLDIVRADSWLHSFGIIGLFDRSRTNEEELLNQLSSINLLAVYDYSRAVQQLPAAIGIIRENRQLIFQHDLSRKLVRHLSASFIIPNDPLLVPVYAGLATVCLAQHGLIGSDNRVQLQIVLTELLLNAIEHGNCEITMEEKSQHLTSGGSIVELVEEKCLVPAVAERRVFFQWETHEGFTRFRIKDEGRGFDVEKYRDKLMQRGIDALNGRGILMARQLASRLAYNKKGNKVLLEFPHSAGNLSSAPSGFANEELITVSRGDVIFREGESDDYLYYIISGTYVVYHDGEKVGVMTPADIFMGEMAFLLNYTRNATVITERAGRLIRIPRERFVRIIRQHPHYGLFLAKLLARKLANANRIHAEASASLSFPNRG
ncbi:cyclic nucleotide-binding domain-containing protein [Spirochaeta africana]|uniref:Cyclic nucleotide-binding protein n=1 Tax=Spirochaeta africana (strain ATCC 700263 / DSM 8902 / Z-7692) TaxID=889378 RepID=H9UG40_SPIAZ|nr:cyclic nucleotide-binding domain-containing protein [Spirochaeta africana]AFG36483.1 cyclic nucleotide-binding protein [Spirochaeta africana DSM 8902]